MGSLPATYPIKYPRARRDHSIVDDYHGIPVADPYRWLEDPNAEEAKGFVEAQMEVTEQVVAACARERELLREKITQVFDHPRYDAPVKRGDRYVYLRNSGLQAQSALCMQEGSSEVVLVDPNELNKDGTLSLAGYAVSEDGGYVAYGISEKGSDWVTIRAMRMTDMMTLQDTISWVKFSAISWTHDGKGFFYSRFPPPSGRHKMDAGTETNINLNQEVYYHFLGTDQSQDILCWRDPEHPKYIYEARVTEDGEFCLLYIEEGCDPVNKLYYCELSSLPQGLYGFKGRQCNLPFSKLVDNFDGRYSYVANDGPNFTFLTNKDAPRSKLVRVNIAKPHIWIDVLRESENDVLEMARAVNGNQLVVSYISDVKYKLQLRDLNTGRFLHRLPIDIGTVFQVTGRRNDTESFIGFTSFLTPGIIYRCNLASGEPQMTVFREAIIRGVDRSDFHVKQDFTSSRDGTRLPMFIFCKKGIPMNGLNPALLYGYGGFSCSLTPSFNVHRIVVAHYMGVVCCIANIRGGGEHLVSSGYTNPSKLCIEGRSNGGLLVASCINQRPDLFGCALAHVGVMDMLRFHKFTIGHAWTTDFGCSDNEEDFQWLIRYSPLHNVRRPWEEDGYPPYSQYPSTMLLTADHDDRVVPLHSLKLLATMQYVLCLSDSHSLQTNPIIARIDRKAGHGAGRSTQKMIDEAVDRYGFMAKMLGVTWIS